MDFHITSNGILVFHISFGSEAAGLILVNQITVTGIISVFNIVSYLLNQS